MDAIEVAMNQGGLMRVRKVLFLATICLAMAACMTVAFCNSNHPEPIIFSTHGGPVPWVAFCPEGMTLTTAREDKTIEIWDVTTGRRRATLQAKGDGICSSPDGKILAILDNDRFVTVWDVATACDRAKFKVDTCSFHTSCLSQEGKTLALGYKDGTIALWNSATGLKQTDSGRLACEVNSLAFSLDGKALAAGGADGTIKLWDVATAKELIALPGHKNEPAAGIQELVFSPDGETLASVSWWANVKLWNLATGKNTATLEGNDEMGSLCIAFSPDSKTLASVGSQDLVKLWDVASGDKIAAFEFGYRPPSRVVKFFGDIVQRVGWTRSVVSDGHFESVLCVSFTRDGKPVAFSDDNRHVEMVKMWQLGDLPNEKK
jgi:WD40 repeat protein